MNFNSYYQQQPNPMDEMRKFFRSGSGLSILILVNVAIWVIIQIIKVFLFFLGLQESNLINEVILHTLAVPAYLPLLVSTPWSLITYMFLHLDFWHLLFNMLWLYWFGRIFREFLPNRTLVIIYFLGGLAGALTYITAFNTFPVYNEILPVSFALGASASVMAIVTAISFFVPNYTIPLLFFGKIKIMYLAIALFIFDFFMIPTGNSGGHLAHIGGALFGFLYAMYYRKRVKTWQPGQGKDIFGFVNDWFRKKNSSGSAGTYSQGRPMTDDEYNRRKMDNQRKTDEILEKISKGGYDSLTREEKEFLFNSSKKP
jgi:membrane associated rhomboid family serine protease